MSVSLTLQTTDTGEFVVYIPISPQSFFDEYWMAISKALRLEWIPLFYNLLVEAADVPFILDELVQIKTYLASSPYSLSIQTAVCERIEKLENGLKQIQTDTKLKGYIG